MLVSIIMPSYNADRDLVEKAISSFKAQDYEDKELIIVDDGSTPESASYLDCFACENIRVIHKDNAGQAVARKIGIMHSKGEYVGFLDADDYFEPSFLSKMMKRISDDGSEMADCSFFVDNGDKSTKEFFRKGDCVLNKTSAISLLLGDCFMRGFLWNKVFKKDILLASPRAEYKSKHLFEDLPLVFGSLLKVNKVSYLKEPLYHYRKDVPTSSTSQKNALRAKEHLESFLLIKVLADINGDEEIKHLVRRSYVRSYLSLFYDIGLSRKSGLSRKESRKIRKDLRFMKNKNSDLGDYSFLLDLIVN